MEMDLLLSPWLDRYDELIASVRGELLISVPYLTRKYIHRALEILTRGATSSRISFQLITSLEAGSLLSGSLALDALLEAIDVIPQTRIIDLRGLHAKVYIADENLAVVTSANLTDGGLLGNYEYGVFIRNSEQVRQIRADMLKYAALGAPTDRQTLEILRDTSTELQKLQRRSENSIRAQFRRALNKKIEITERELLRNRVRGRTKNAIFSQAILYLLEKKAMATIELEQQIKAILPDMCDDKVDRVIDGVHFGKLWKHDVRNAQQYLKRNDQIKSDGIKWALA